MSSNKLKVVAIFSMIIDHIGYYFNYAMSDNVYFLCRAVGRIAMPIFVFLMVQGYFNTKNIKKYRLRLFASAVVTQMAILAMKYVNTKYFSLYVTNVYNVLNILFSLFLSLVLICLIDRKIFYANGFVTSVFDKLIRVLAIFGVIYIFFNVQIDYLWILPLIAIFLYIIEKVRIFCGYDVNSFEYKVLLATILLILLSFTGFVVGKINVLSIFAIVFIVLYNGKLGKKNKFLRNLFYFVFPFQHVLLYFFAMTLYEKF